VTVLHVEPRRRGRATQIGLSRRSRSRGSAASCGATGTSRTD
jgi:hypothetical protein